MPDELNVALIGFGDQGATLFNLCRQIPGIRITAVCDIRLQEKALYAKKVMKRFGFTVNAYEDYRELLAQEKNLTAALVTTPDWMHAEQTIACLKAGLHVYCEKEMATTVAQAREVVATARSTGRLLQIGHQRFSNPRYQHAVALVHDQLLGRVTQIQTHWRRCERDLLSAAEKFQLDASSLARWGYHSMQELLNWRWYRKYSNGPFVDMASHQCALFPWFLGCQPESVLAAGGREDYPEREWYGNVTALFTFRTASGLVRTTCQVVTTTGHGGNAEIIYGSEGTLVIAEQPVMGDLVERESGAPSWENLVKQGRIIVDTSQAPPDLPDHQSLDVRVSQPAGRWRLPAQPERPVHLSHLENFIAAIRTGCALNCPAERAFPVLVALLKVQEAIATGQTLSFTPEEFLVKEPQNNTRP